MTSVSERSGKLVIVFATPSREVTVRARIISERVFKIMA
jgi:hypothetical protein